LAIKMKNLILTITLAVVAVAVACGCHSMPRPRGDARSYDLHTKAAVAALDWYFSRQWGYGKVFIAPNDHIPTGLNQVGAEEAEVLSRDALMDRFRGSDRDPLLT